MDASVTHQAVPEILHSSSTSSESLFPADEVLPSTRSRTTRDSEGDNSMVAAAALPPVSLIVLSSPSVTPLKAAETSSSLLTAMSSPETPFSKPDQTDCNSNDNLPRTSNNLSKKIEKQIMPPPPPISKEGLIARSSYPIHSSYLVKEKIGQGTWGSVHVALERASGLERAVKKVPKRFTSELARFRQEVVFLRSLDHPNIVRLYETFEDYSNIYLVMEYCRGGELFDRVAKSMYFSEATAAKLMHQILSSVCYIHAKNISHRDLKPENFLFSSCNNNSPMKLIDFGLAKRFSKRRQLRTKVGTLYYVSPQVLQGAYDEKCDIWSAGIILYLLLSGTPPFNGPTDACIIQQIKDGELTFSAKIWNKVSSQAKDLIKFLLKKDANARPSAGDALNHEWFRMFVSSPFKTLCGLPRPLSVPSDASSCLSSRTTSSSKYCCDLSVVGIHSPLCETRTVSIGGVHTTVNPLLAAAPHSVQFSLPGIAVEQECPRTPVSVDTENSVGEFSPDGPSPKICYQRRLEEWANLAKKLVPKWKRFAMHNQLKRAALRVIAQQLHDGEDDMLPLRMLFLALDSKNDGTLSSEEITSGMKQMHESSRTGCLCRSGSSRASSFSSANKQTSPPCDDAVDSDDAALTFRQHLLESDKEAESDRPIKTAKTNVLRTIAARTGRDEIPSSISVGSCLNDIAVDNLPEFDSGAELADLVNGVSLDGANSLEYSDFIAASMDQKHYMRDGVLKAAFRVFDRDGDGRINPSELKATLGWSDMYNQEAYVYGRRNDEAAQMRNSIGRMGNNLYVEGNAQLLIGDGGPPTTQDFVRGFNDDEDEETKTKK